MKYLTHREMFQRICWKISKLCDRLGGLSWPEEGGDDSIVRRSHEEI